MNYFSVGLTDSNRIWSKLITFSENYLYVNSELKFPDLYRQEVNFDMVKVQALKDGEISLNQHEFSNMKLGEFNEVRSTILIRNSIYLEELFTEFSDTNFFDIKINGDFEDSYKILYFKNLINCKDISNSVYKRFNYSLPVLIRSKLPASLGGFFLSGWNSGIESRYINVVNENLKDKLLKLEKASNFLVFTKLDIVDE